MMDISRFEKKPKWIYRVLKKKPNFGSQFPGIGTVFEQTLLTAYGVYPKYMFSELISIFEKMDISRFEKKLFK